MSVLRFALEYAALGWRMFPCARRSKAPFGRLVPRGCLDASRDPDRARQWWYAVSTLNVAIACGEGLAVLDVDPRNRGDEELALLERTHGKLPDTPRVLTGRGDGGVHLYFHSTVDLKNGALRGCKGLELKSAGGYVLAPPSVHPDTGQAYEWDLGALPSETPLAALPAWVSDSASHHSRGPGALSTGIDARLSVLGQIFEKLHGLGDVLADGRRCVKCPWFAEHSDGRGDGRDTSCVIFPRTSDSVVGGFRCSHAHCTRRNWRDVFDLVPVSVKNAAARALAEELRGVV